MRQFKRQSNNSFGRFRLKQGGKFYRVRCREIQPPALDSLETNLLAPSYLTHVRGQYTVNSKYIHQIK